MIRINRVKIKEFYQMGLSINPISKLVAGVSEKLQTAAAEIKAAGPKIASDIKKADLDAKISRLSGDVGSGLNGASTTSLIDAAQTGMGQVSSIVDTPVGSDSIGSFSDAVGAVQKFGGNIAKNLGVDIEGSLADKIGGNLATGIKTFAGKVSEAAGNLNDILSLKRGENIPAGGELFTTTGEAIKVNPSSKEDWRVRINCQWNIFNSDMFKLLEETGGVVFPIQPSVTLSTKANYSNVEPTHNNYPFMAYKNSQVDEIQINGKFIAETETDAAYWLAATTFFKTATKMFYGKGENAGNPPVVCQLNGYGSNVFENVPVVVKSFSVTFPEDVNYVRCTKFTGPTWVPILSTINVIVQPIYNRADLRQFDLKKYASGKMVNGGQGYL
jgi:hypothetical protein